MEAHMIFNSFEFIFVFLPIVFIVYFILNKINFSLSKAWLLVSSLFFYSWWNPIYLPLILVSMFINFGIGRFLAHMPEDRLAKRKTWLTIGIVLNVLLLSYFKYYDFFVSNVNSLFDSSIALKNLVLPLAISFYTFQQIAYLVDSYRYETKNYHFLNYGLFVTFFPQLIAGPIIHHSSVMHQFEDVKNRKINYRNIAIGLFIFAIGLFKKVGIADTFAKWANEGYAAWDSLGFMDVWITTLSYTFQLYFDFSGYSDMAIGLGLLFNITISLNFNSPYKALSIQDFWRRWHITLSHFLTTYIYIPLGGNRKGVTRTYINIMIIFFVSGIWHGAGWTFIIWGLMHGFASVINRYWSNKGFKMNKALGWLITFMFVHFAWVFFRAPSVEIANEMIQTMIGLNGIDLTVASIHSTFAAEIWKVAIVLIVGFLIVVKAPNAYELRTNFKPSWRNVVFVSVLVLYSIFQLQQVSPFLYFNF